MWQRQNSWYITSCNSLSIAGYYGGMYASNFNAYGKLFRVMIQGTVESRMNEDGLTNIYVRTAGGMAPVSEFCTLKRVYGPSNITRFTSLPLSQSMLHQLMVTLLVRLFRLQRRLQNKYCHRVMVMSSPGLTRFREGGI